MRELFDLDPNLIYLNSGTHSITPRNVLEAIARYQRGFELNPTEGLFDIWEHLWKVQGELARFFGARAEDIFLRSNITEAMNQLILGVDLAPGGEILVSDLEYGAIHNICRFRAEREQRGFRSLHLPVGNEDGARSFTDEDWVEKIVSQIRPGETRLLLLSHVATGTGLLLPIAKIAVRTRALGVVLAIDGAHAAGDVPIDFGALGDVDLYGANLHKWMMGPKGTSFGWVAPRHQEKMVPLEAGWTTFEMPPAFVGFGGGSRFQGRMMLSASQDFSPFFAIHEMLEFWKAQGADRIRARTAQLRACLDGEVASALGWAALAPSDPRQRGPLLSYEMPEAMRAMDPGALRLHYFRQHRVQFAFPIVQGRACLRLSPHIYNTEDECVRAVGILKSDSE